MQVAEHPRHRPFPGGMTQKDKLRYLSTGKVTVGKFGRIKSRDFVNFYLPRIRGKNFAANSRRFKHPGYQTSDQAFAAGVVLQAKFKKDL